MGQLTRGWTFERGADDDSHHLCQPATSLTRGTWGLPVGLARSPGQLHCCWEGPHCCWDTPCANQIARSAAHPGKSSADPRAGTIPPRHGGPRMTQVGSPGKAAAAVAPWARISGWYQVDCLQSCTHAMRHDPLSRKRYAHAQLLSISTHQSPVKL